ncbi:MAG: hypothetical protein H6732_02190 [Alphaproteobacteria bacterium]|nr:hypothetical protein [Alphaproteobacteria bacterium]
MRLASLWMSAVLSVAACSGADKDPTSTYDLADDPDALVEACTTEGGSCPAWVVSLAEGLDLTASEWTYLQGLDFASLGEEAVAADPVFRKMVLQTGEGLEELGLLSFDVRLAKTGWPVGLGIIVTAFGAYAGVQLVAACVANPPTCLVAVAVGAFLTSTAFSGEIEGPSAYADPARAEELGLDPVGAVDTDTGGPVDTGTDTATDGACTVAVGEVVPFAQLGSCNPVRFEVVGTTKGLYRGSSDIGGVTIVDDAGASVRYNVLRSDGRMEIQPVDAPSDRLRSYLHANGFEYGTWGGPELGDASIDFEATADGLFFRNHAGNELSAPGVITHPDLQGKVVQLLYAVPPNAGALLPVTFRAVLAAAD